MCKLTDQNIDLVKKTWTCERYHSYGSGAVNILPYFFCFLFLVNSFFFWISDRYKRIRFVVVFRSTFLPSFNYLFVFVFFVIWHSKRPPRNIPPLFFYTVGAAAVQLLTNSHLILLCSLIHTNKHAYIQSVRAPYCHCVPSLSACLPAGLPVSPSPHNFQSSVYVIINVAHLHRMVWHPWEIFMTCFYATLAAVASFHGPRIASLAPDACSCRECVSASVWLAYLNWVLLLLLLPCCLLL